MVSARMGNPTHSTASEIPSARAVTVKTNQKRPSGKLAIRYAVAAQVRQDSTSKAALLAARRWASSIALAPDGRGCRGAHRLTAGGHAGQWGSLAGAGRGSTSRPRHRRTG